MEETKLLEIIKSKQPLCDDCLQVENEDNIRQNTRRKCLKLEKLSLIFREKGICSKCNKTNKTTNFINKEKIKTLIKTMNNNDLLTKKSTSLILKTEINIQWKRVFVNTNLEYTFPSVLSKNLDGPAIYKWTIYKNDEIEHIYIGETKQLCNRINFYNKPGKKQATNIRINQFFNERKLENRSIKLELLDFESFYIGTQKFNINNLNDKSFRKFLEEYLVVYYKSLNYNLLNSSGRKTKEDNDN